LNNEENERPLVWYFLRVPSILKGGDTACNSLKKTAKNDYSTKEGSGLTFVGNWGGGACLMDNQ
jgi:hypothetical protein